jgi:hypothetical protein
LTFRVIQSSTGNVGQHALRHATAAKAVNSVAAVCVAPPGMVSLRDLPIVQVHGLMR